MNSNLKKNNVNLKSLPLKILSRVFSYLSGIELMSIAQVLDTSRVKQIIGKQKLKFTSCYSLSEQQLLNFLNQFFLDERLRVDLDHCYWLSSSCILNIVNYMSLREIHLVECDVTYNVIETILQLPLTALSISWTKIWETFISLGSENLVEEAIIPNLFQHLRHLTVCIDLENTSSLATFTDHFLLLCKNVEYFKIFNKTALPVTYTPHKPKCSADSKIQSKILLPNLKHLVIDLSNRYAWSPIENLIRSTIPDETMYLELTQLFKNNSQYLKSNVVNLYYSSIKNDRMILQLNTLKFETEYGKGTETTFVDLAERIVSASDNKIREIKFNFIIYPLLTKFFEGLQLIAMNCKQITHLDISRCIFEDKESSSYFSSVLEIVGSFKELTHLSFDCVLLSPKNIKKHRKQMELPEIVEKSDGACINEIEKLANSCKNLQYLKIIGSRTFSSRLVPESKLKAISNIRQLKELHLIKLKTLSKGSYLSLITKKCTLLHSLYLNDICLCDFDATALEECLLHAKSIRTIYLGQQFCMSENFIANLKACSFLEKLLIEGATISLDIAKSLNDALAKMINLYVFYLIMHPSFFEDSHNFDKVWNLEQIKTDKPAFCYYINSVKNVSQLEHSFSRKYRRPFQKFHPCEEHWPQEHLNALFYSSAYTFSPTFFWQSYNNHEDLNLAPKR